MQMVGFGYIYNIYFLFVAWLQLALQVSTAGPLTAFLILGDQVGH